MEKYKFKIETIAEDKSKEFITWISFCGVPKKYIFTTLKRDKPDDSCNRQLLAKNSRDSGYLEESEITEENLKKFHLESIDYFNNLKN